MKVLIVEDAPVIRDALIELLAHWGLVTEACDDGLKALQLPEASAFDLMLLDLNLPSLDGLEACRPLQHDWRWGLLMLTLDGRSASYDNQDLHLTPKEHALLESLLKAAGRTCSKDQLIEAAWHWADVPGNESVKTHVKNIRAKLSAAGAPPDLVETVYGVGFRLNASHA